MLPSAGELKDWLIFFLKWIIIHVFPRSPFDVEDLTLSSGNLSKATALQRRVSVYSQGTPETPTFQDTAFFVSSFKKIDCFWL